MTGAQIVLDRTHAEQGRTASAREKPSLRDYLFKVRRDTGFDRYDAIVFAIYIAILAFAIHQYLPFADEAQEWLIARDSSLHDLLFRRLHYEGHPPLWALILWVVARLRMPYAGINWMAGAFALPGIYLFLRYSPFPRVFRWLLPFTFFLQYQYAAIARPYVFFPALLFAMCIIFTLDRPRPVLFGLVTGLLTNISLHAAIVAGVFCLLYLHQLRGRRRQEGLFIPRRSVAAGAALFVLMALCSALTAFPAPDAAVAYSPYKPVIGSHAFLDKLIPEEKLPPSAPPLDKPLDPDGSKAKAESAPKINPVLSAAATTLVLGANAACYPLAESNLLAIGFLGAFWLWLWARGCSRLILPFLVATGLSVHIFVYDHHTGIFLLSLVAAAWTALQTVEGNTLAQKRLPRIEYILSAIALLVVILQIGWSWHCIRGSISVPSDPGRQTEEFLAQNYSGKQIAAFGYQSISIQPYASQNLFSNQSHSFWLWSANVPTNRRRTEALLQHPDAVVVSDITVGNEIVLDQWLHLVPVGTHPYHELLEFWQQNGYRETHHFCGSQYRRKGLADTMCDVVLEPIPAWKTDDVSGDGVQRGHRAAMIAKSM
jgi:hypothetical protein